MKSSPPLQYLDRLWHRFIWPIVKGRGKLEEKAFIDYWERLVSRYRSAKAGRMFSEGRPILVYDPGISQMALERRVLQPYANTLGMQSSKQIVDQTIRPLLRGETSEAVYKKFARLISILDQEGLVEAFLYWLDEKFPSVGDIETDVRRISLALRDEEGTVEVRMQGRLLDVYTPAAMGFKKSEKTWERLVKILASGSDYFNYSCDADRKVIERMNNKLVTFSNETWT